MDAWKNRDVDSVMNTIARNCEYYESVFDEPCSDFNEIRKLWEVIPVNQKNIEYDYKIILGNEKFCIVNFFLKRTLVPSGVEQYIDGILQISLDEKGLCKFFKQWRSIKE